MGNRYALLASSGSRPAIIIPRCEICFRSWESDVCPLDGGAVTFEVELQAFRDADKLVGEEAEQSLPITPLED